MFRLAPKTRPIRAPGPLPWHSLLSQPGPLAGRIVVPMDEPALKQLIQDLLAGTVSPDEAVTILRRLPFADLGFAKVDHHRALRQHCGEAVYAPGKTVDQCARILAELLE